MSFASAIYLDLALLFYYLHTLGVGKGNPYLPVKSRFIFKCANVEQYFRDNFGAKRSNLVIESFLESCCSGAAGGTIFRSAGVTIRTEHHRGNVARSEYNFSCS